MPNLDHFGIMAPFYDRAIPLRHAETLIEKADLPTSGALLDAGGGTGRVAEALRGLASVVVVVDNSLNMLQQGRLKDGLCLVNSPTERLPFPSESFERVIMIDALHHVNDQAETAKELWRVLKPGGQLVIEEPDIRTLLVKLVAIVEKLALMRSHFLGPAEIASLFSSPEAKTNIQNDKFNTWVMVEKTKSANPGQHLSRQHIDNSGAAQIGIHQ